MLCSLFIIMLVLSSSQSKDSCLKLQGSIIYDLTRQNRTASFKCSITPICQHGLISLSMMEMVQSEDSKTGNVAILKNGTTVEGWKISEAAGSLAKSGPSFLSVTFPLDNINSDRVYVDCIARGLNSRNESVVIADSLKFITSTRRKENTNMALYCGRMFMYNGTEYCLSRNVVKTVTQAINNCSIVGGYLAEIEDRDEYLAIQAEVSKANIENVLLSGTDEAKEGSWVYQHSRTPVKFFDWNPHEPTNLDGNEHCLEIRKNFAYKMNDIACLNSAFGDPHFLCELMQ